MQMLIMPKVKKYQTTLDVAVQHGGSADVLLPMCAKIGVSITDNLMPGSDVNAPTVNSQVINFFIESRLDVITVEPIQLGGIGYMRIGSTFKVS
jgi:hypothetical protein